MKHEGVAKQSGAPGFLFFNFASRLKIRGAEEDGVCLGDLRGIGQTCLIWSTETHVPKVANIFSDVFLVVAPASCAPGDGDVIDDISFVRIIDGNRSCATNQRIQIILVAGVVYDPEVRNEKSFNEPPPVP